MTLEENIKINYIIASYAVKNKRKYSYPEDTLKIHLRQLRDLKHNLTQITLMKADPGDKEIYPDYYDDELEREMNLEIHHVENQGYSNGQWLRGYERRKMEYDYYIFCEDDYCPGIHGFDKILLKLYREKARDNICFLASLIQGHPKHQMCTPLHYEGLVMVSKETLEKLYSIYPNPKQYLSWTDPPFINILPGGREQVNFTTLFRINNIPILDTIEDDFKFIYWNDSLTEKYGGEVFNFEKSTEHSEIVNKYYYENFNNVYLNCYNDYLCFPIQFARTCVLIAGMHRSGTSALSGCLNLVGLDYGKNKAEVKDNFNQKGYFENMSILNFNEKVLASMKSSWHDTEMLTENQIEIMLKSSDELFTLIRSQFSTNTFFIKDPRISILLPLYLSVLKRLCIQVVIVFIDRNNGSIAQSLQRAQGISYHKGLNLCNKYKNSLLKYKQDHKFLLWKFDDFMDNPYNLIKNILKELRFGQNLVHTDIKKIKSFIDKNYINF